MSAPTPEQTLRALAKVSRGEVWNHTPQPDTWKPIGAVVAAMVYKHCEAAE